MFKYQYLTLDALQPFLSWRIRQVEQLDTVHDGSGNRIAYLYRVVGEHEYYDPEEDYALYEVQVIARPSDKTIECLCIDHLKDGRLCSHIAAVLYHDKELMPWWNPSEKKWQQPVAEIKDDDPLVLRQCREILALKHATGGSFVVECGLRELKRRWNSQVWRENWGRADFIEKRKEGEKLERI